MAVFAAVVEKKSFSAAARHLGVAKSAVSRHISQLEVHFDVRLLHRTTRSISLTDAGEQLYPICAQIVAEAARADEVVSSMKNEPTGTLHLAASEPLASEHILPTVADYMLQYPAIKTKISIADDQVDLIGEGIDLAIRVGRLNDSSLIARKLASAKILLCASPEYLIRNGTPTEPRDLPDHDWIAYQHLPAPDRWRFRTPGGGYKLVVVKPRTSTNHGPTLRALLVNHLGISAVPDFLAAPLIADGRLQVLLADYTLAPSAIYAVYPSNRHMLPKVRLLVDRLAERLSGW